MKLYKVTIRNHPVSKYNETFVVAENSGEAYKKVRAFLDKNDLCFTKGRELKMVELLADTNQYGECDVMLFLD